MKCNYQKCGETLSPDQNGNRRYCSSKCYLAEKLERSTQKHDLTSGRKNKVYYSLADFLKYLQPKLVNPISNNFKNNNNEL